MEEIIPDEEFFPETFESTLSIRWMHEAPRYGYTSNIELFANQNEALRQQYVNGTVFISALILLFFFVWNTTLLLHKFLGSSRVGWTSGSVPVFPIPKHGRDAAYSFSHDEDDANNKEKIHDKKTQKEIKRWQREYSAAISHLKGIRLAFIICGALVLIASFALYIAGFTPLNDAFTESYDLITELDDALKTSAGQMNVQNEVGSNEELVKRKESIVELIENTCPLVENNFTISLDDIVGDLDPDFYIVDSNGDYVILVELLRMAAAEGYTRLNDFGVATSDTVKGVLESASANANEIQDEMDQFLYWYGLSIFVVVAIDAIAICLMFGVFMAQKTKPSKMFESVLSYILLPIFILLIDLSWVVTATFAVVTILSADVCTGSPETNLKAVFHEKQASMETLLYDMTVYYVEKCNIYPVPVDENPTKIFGLYSETFGEVTSITDAFVNQFAAIDPTVYETNCGASIENITVAMDEFKPYLEQVSNATNDSIESLYCSQFTPIYTDIMHDEVCYNGVQSLTIVFIMLLVVTVSGMVMVTFRVAYKSTTFDFFDGEEKDKQDEFQVVDADEAYPVTTGLKEVPEETSEAEEEEKFEVVNMKNVEQDREDSDRQVLSSRLSAVTAEEEKDEIEVKI